MWVLYINVVSSVLCPVLRCTNQYDSFLERKKKTPDTTVHIILLSNITDLYSLKPTALKKSIQYYYYYYYYCLNHCWMVKQLIKKSFSFTGNKETMSVTQLLTLCISHLIRSYFSRSQQHCLSTRLHCKHTSTHSYLLHML